MLVLSRGRHEAVFVGDDVKVTVLEIRTGDEAAGGGKVKLGFQAPKDVSIQRQEILERRKSKSSSGPHQHRAKPDIAGTLRVVRDARVQLLIQAPPEMSIHCSRASQHAPGHRTIVPHCPTESISPAQDPTTGAPPGRVINCQKEDNILIGHHLLITIVGVYQFVPDPSPSRGGPARVSENGG